MTNVKYIKKVILPKNEECIFVDQTWRNSPAYKITKANILNWNTKFSKMVTQDQVGQTIAPLDQETGQIPSEYIPTSVIDSTPPITYLTIYATLRNDQDIKLANTQFDEDTNKYNYILTTKQNSVGELAHTPVNKVFLSRNILKQDYEIYFVADSGFMGVYVENPEAEQGADNEYIVLSNNRQSGYYYEFSSDEQCDFNFIEGHLYRILAKDHKIKDCSNLDISFTNGIHQKTFFFTADPNESVVGKAAVGTAIVAPDEEEQAIVDYSRIDSAIVG